MGEPCCVARWFVTEGLAATASRESSRDRHQCVLAEQLAVCACSGSYDETNSGTEAAL